MKRNYLVLICVLCSIVFARKVNAVPSNVELEATTPHLVLRGTKEFNSDQCGPNVHAVLDSSSNTLKFSVINKDSPGVMRNFSYFNGDFPPWHDALYKNVINSIEIGEGIINIGAFAFLDLEVLTDAAIANSVKTIGDSAFKKCTQLREVSLGSEDGSKLAWIQDGAFMSSGLMTVTIPDSVATIGNGAFRDCRRLRCVVVGSKESRLSEIRPEAFFGSSPLYSFTYFGKKTIECSSEAFGSTLVKEIKVTKSFEAKGLCNKKTSVKSGKELQCEQVWEDDSEAHLKEVNNIDGMCLASYFASGFSILVSLVSMSEKIGRLVESCRKDKQKSGKKPSPSQ